MAAVGGVLTTSVISLAQPPPPLPPRTAAQLLTALTANPSAPALSGTVVETASLGLPALPAIVGPISLSSFLSGSHVIKVWYADPAHYRIAIPQTDSESDLIRNGSNAWLWGSSVNMVEHMTLPAGGEQSPAVSLPLTPQQAADQVLARVGPTTTAGVQANVTVAGEAAYQLVLAPKDSGSLIGQVRVAIDGRHDLPLRVQVFAKHATGPALQVGFSSLSFGQPATQNFAFTPPAGAAVVQESPGSGGTASATAWGNDLANGSKVIGSSWLTVLDLPESALTGTAPAGGPASSSAKPTGLIGSSSTSAGPGAGGSGAGGSGLAALGVDTGSIFSAFMQSAERVSGSWGSGRLMQTPLVSMLVTSDGRVLVGAVTPNVLYQAAAHEAQAPTAQRHHAAEPVTSK